MSHRIASASWILLAWLVPASTGLGQGFLVDRHGPRPIPRSFEIREVTIDSVVRDQVAQVQVSQVFHNPGSTTIDAEFLFPLPEEGAVQGFVLLVDGKELPGRLMEKEEARRIYEEIVRTKRDPALLEYAGRGLFRTSVFPIPPGADRKVTMRYAQVCKRERDVVEFVYPLATQKFTAKPIRRLALDVRIESRDPIKSLYCPSHDAKIVRTGDHEAKVALELRDVVPTTDFRLLSTLAKGSIGVSVVSRRPSAGEDGYFLLLAAPEVKASEAKPLPKTVVFVLDRSGSMAGKKIEQARKALQFVLDNLRDDDLFNIVVYDDRVETFKPELQRYSSASREEAARFVSNIREGGSTNISAAVEAAMDQIKDESRPGYVLFLTDGLPTAGVTNELEIAEIAKRSNRMRARLFVFGVGHDVNARLLDRMSGSNSGTSEYVRPDEDIESHVAAFYSKLTRPALSRIGIAFTGTDVNRTYPRDIPDLFEGGQLVWVGRYSKSGKSTLKLTGKVGGETFELQVPVELADVGDGTRYDFVEKLWAIRRVGDIIDKVDLQGRNSELTEELVRLSKQYGILTPYTSFLADERVDLHASVDNYRVAGENLRRLAVVQGNDGVAQRGAKQGYLQMERADTASASSAGLAALPPTSAPAPARAGSQVMLGRGLAARPAAPSAPAQLYGSSGPAAAPIQDAESRDRLDSNVRRVGTKTFFRKCDRWVDSALKPEDEAKAQAVEQYSEEFFRIARGLSPESSQYLAFDEPVTVILEGRVYRFDKPKSGR
ncbi:MAG: VIT domain-containing protein [Isosphaeraceae bacterium]|nr:VIT domain-containing protein [Isosphaeraceae bacterium]